MKTLLLIPFLFIYNMVIGQAPGKGPYPAPNPNYTRQIGALEWHSRPYGYQLWWQDARERCYGLGNGWRMPTQTELAEFYRNGGFGTQSGYFWTSTPYDDRYVYVLYKHGSTAEWVHESKTASNFVWAVR